MAGRDHRDAGGLEPRPSRPAGRALCDQPDRAQVQRPAEHDMALCVKYKVPIIITSLGARADVNEAVHSYGGIVLHDIINNAFAHKAIEKGADGLIAVAAGAGGHAGVKSPFALIQEIREWFDGPLALSAAPSPPAARCWRRRPWAPTSPTSARPSSPPTRPARRGLQAVHRRQQRRRHRLLQPVHRRARQLPEAVDPHRRPGPRQSARSDPSKMNFGGGGTEAKAWKDIWGCGQGIGAVKAVRAGGRTGGAAEARVRGGAPAHLRRAEHGDTAVGP